MFYIHFKRSTDYLIWFANTNHLHERQKNYHNFFLNDRFVDHFISRMYLNHLDFPEMQFTRNKKRINSIKKVTGYLISVSIHRAPWDLSSYKFSNALGPEAMNEFRKICLSCSNATENHNFIIFNLKNCFHQF